MNISMCACSWSKLDKEALCFVLNEDENDVSACSSINISRSLRSRITEMAPPFDQTVHSARKKQTRQCLQIKAGWQKKHTGTHTPQVDTRISLRSSQREKQRETDRDSDRQTETESDIYRQKEPERHREREGMRERESDRENERGRQREKERGREKERETE